MGLDVALASKDLIEEFHGYFTRMEIRGQYCAIK